jgi:hypothetical protein
VGGRLQRRRLGEDGSGGCGSGEEQTEGALRRRRRRPGPASGDWASGVVGCREQCGGCILYVVDLGFRVEWFMGQLMGFMDWQKMAHLIFFLFFSSFLTLYYFYIFLFLYITKVSPRLAPYRLKDKKGACRLDSPYRLKNYAFDQN